MGSPLTTIFSQKTLIALDHHGVPHVVFHKLEHVQHVGALDTAKAMLECCPVSVVDWSSPVVETLKVWEIKCTSFLL